MNKFLLLFTLSKESSLMSLGGNVPHFGDKFSKLVFSNFYARVTSLKILFKCRFWLNRSGVRFESPFT